MEISAKYNPEGIEQRWYNEWMEQKLFSSIPDNRPSYTIVMPPPNVTGILHMGHMLNNTIQDILVRRSRMLGYNACWVPGTDHASIATEAKVVAKLKEQGIEFNKGVFPLSANRGVLLQGGDCRHHRHPGVPVPRCDPD